MTTVHIAVIGAGRWGCTLAQLQAQAGHVVSVWTRHFPEKTSADTSLPGSAPRPYHLTTNLAETLNGARIILLAIPSAALRPTVRLLAPLLTSEQLIVSATKGLEPGTGLRVSQVWAAELTACCPQSQWQPPFVALSGPNLAAEIGRGLPAAAVVAGNDAPEVRRVRDTLGTPLFRLYSSDDLIGVELGGSLKNVLAIASGIGDGLHFGDNTRAALLTRGLAEIARLGVAAGAQERTFAGLSGLGDVLATCTSPLSRNYHLGFQIGQGTSVSTALAQVAGVAEGVGTAQAALDLATSLGLDPAHDMPIASEVQAVLTASKDPRAAVGSLLARELKDE